MHSRATLIPITGGLLLAAGVAVAFLRFLGEVPPGQNLECGLGAAALGAVIAAPGALALLAVRDRPALLLPAAILLIPLSFLSFAGVLLPLLIPSFLLFRAYARSAGNGSGWRAAAMTVAVLGLLVAAVAALFAHADPREYMSGTTTYGTSDIITYGEALLSMTLTATALLVGWWLSRSPSPAVAPGTRGPDTETRLRRQPPGLTFELVSARGGDRTRTEP